MHVSHDAELALLFALIRDVADTVGARVLVIKGRSAVQHGLRAARPCGDVDLFLPPRDVAPLLRELAARGWQQRPVDEDTLTFPPHAATLVKSGWRHDIDVHFAYPGIETDDPFPFLWDARVPLAGTPLETVAPPAAVIIEALHLLRAGTARQDNLQAFGEQVHPQFSELEILATARALNADGAMRPFLQAVWGTPAEELQDPSPAWMLRTKLTDPLARRIFLAATQRTARRAIFQAALFPRTGTLLKTSRPRHGSVPLSTLLYLRGRRWIRGAVHIPTAIRLAWRYALEQDRRTHVEGPRQDD